MLLRENGIAAWIFDPSELSVWASRRADGALTPTRAEEALAQNPDADAVLDGPMFSLCGTGGYARSDCATSDYRVVAEGIGQQGRNPESGLTFSVTPAGALAVYPGAMALPNARIVVQTYPTLVRDGVRIVSNQGTNRDRNWRAALARLRTGRLAFAIQYADMQTFADALIALGATDAGYTDGGGSTSLAIRGEERLGSSENRRVPVWLLAHRPRASRAAQVFPWALAAGLAGSAYLLARVWLQRDRSASTSRAR